MQIAIFSFNWLSRLAERVTTTLGTGTDASPTENLLIGDSNPYAAPSAAEMAGRARVYVAPPDLKQKLIESIESDINNSCGQFDIGYSDYPSGGTLKVKLLQGDLVAKIPENPTIGAGHDHALRLVEKAKPVVLKENEFVFRSARHLKAGDYILGSYKWNGPKNLTRVDQIKDDGTVIGTKIQSGSRTENIEIKIVDLEESIRLRGGESIIPAEIMKKMGWHSAFEAIVPRSGV